MTNGLSAGTLLALFRGRTSAFTSIATVRLELLEGSHGGSTGIIGFVSRLRLRFANRLIALISLIGADTGPGRSIDVPRNWNRREGMGFQPQCAGGCGRIYASFFPPGGFVARAMGFAMMAPAQRHGELIADLAAERAALREAQMRAVCGRAPADQTRLFGHEPDVLLVHESGAARDGPAGSCRCRRQWLGRALLAPARAMRTMAGAQIRRAIAVGRCPTNVNRA